MIRKGQSHEQHIRSILVRGWKAEKNLCIRAVDVAHFPGRIKASVSIAVRQLRDQDLIDVEPDGNLLFTAMGKNRSDQLGDCVSFFRQLLADTGVEPSQALRDALSFSWEMSEASFEAFRALKTG